MAEDKNVIYPSGGNPSLDPAAILSLERKAGTRGDARLESSFERNSEGILVHHSELESNAREIKKRNERYHPEQTLKGPSDYAASKAVKTEQVSAQREMGGRGAKSGIKSYQKNSAFGRGLDSPLGKAAVGGMQHMIPQMGLNVTGMHLGAFRFAPITWRGAFPVLNLKQWDSAVSASYTNLEEEEGDQ